MTPDPVTTAPMIVEGSAEEIAEGVYVLPDRRVRLVPSVGIVVGEHRALVVDTGTGPENGERVLREARRLAGGRPLLATLTHFHPEHGFGIAPFLREAVVLYNREQELELLEKGEGMRQAFSGRSGDVAELLRDVEMVGPHVSYEGRARLELGGVTADLIPFGGAHTRSDQVVFVPERRVLFAGDLVENRYFPILPDQDANASVWIEVLDALEGLAPDRVVPGHGSVGGPELIRDAKGFLTAARDRVRALAADGGELEEIQETLREEFSAQYPDWENENWIPSAAASFYATVSV